MATAAQSDLVCEICHQLLENPHITPCCLKPLCLKHFELSKSSIVSCPACKKLFALDNLAPDNCRKKYSEKERARLTAQNPRLAQESQYFTEFLGRNFNYKQNYQQNYPLNGGEQTPNFQNQSNFQRNQRSFRNTNQNFGEQNGNFQQDFNFRQCQIDPNLITDAERRREYTCSDCLKKAKCTFCQHHCKLYYCPECYKKHKSDEDQIANLKAVEERLKNIISDISRLLKTELLRRTDRMNLISDAKQALSENFAVSLQRIEETKTELLKRTGEIRSDVEKVQETLSNNEWLLDMLKKGDTNTAKEAKEIFEVHQRKRVLEIGRMLKVLEKEEVPSVSVEKIVMMTNILDGHAVSSRDSKLFGCRQDHCDRGSRCFDKPREVPDVENCLKKIKETLADMNKLALGE
nr:hypothetical protein HmN_000341400 [Hymenolepis microstoma]